MHRAVLSIGAVLVLLVAVLGTAPPARSTHEAGTPGATPAGTPSTFCSPEELNRGLFAPYAPPGNEEGILRPTPATDVFHPTLTGAESLYITVLTLPPDACIDFRERAGAMIFYVQEGSIAYTSRAAFDPNVVITKGDSDGDGADNQTFAPGTLVSLHAGQWLSQDRPVWYSFRNSGGEDAVIFAAVLAAVPWDDERCTGGCRGRP